MENDLSPLIKVSHFDIERKYYYGDIVLYNGCTYFANEDVVEEYPDASSSWSACTISGYLNGKKFTDMAPEIERWQISNVNSNKMWSIQNYLYSASSNTSYYPDSGVSSERAQIELLQNEINKLKSEIVELKKELRFVKTQEETEHRKLGV